MKSRARGGRQTWVYVQRVEPQAQPGAEAERRAPAGQGERFVLALRVEHRAVAAETALPPDEPLQYIKGVLEVARVRPIYLDERC